MCEFFIFFTLNTRTCTHTSIMKTLGRGYQYIQQRECSFLHLFLFLCQLKLLFFMFLIFYTYSSSSFRPASMSQWYAHSMTVVFHTLNRVQRDTRICLLISYILLLCTIYGCYVQIVLLYFPSFTHLPHPLPPPPQPLPAPPPDQVPPVTTTTALLAPSVPFTTTNTCLTVIS